MSGAIALVGGDEFRQGCEEMDRAVLEASGVSTPSLLVLPTAAARENPALAVSSDPSLPVSAATSTKLNLMLTSSLRATGSASRNNPDGSSARWGGPTCEVVDGAGTVVGDVEGAGAAVVDAAAA